MFEGQGVHGGTLPASQAPEPPLVVVGSVNSTN